MTDQTENRKAVLTAPERVWLQVSDDVSHYDEPFPYGEEVTWCQDSALDCEVEYVRLDLVPDPQPDSVRAMGPVEAKAEIDHRQWFCETCGDGVLLHRDGCVWKPVLRLPVEPQRGQDQIDAARYRWLRDAANGGLAFKATVDAGTPEELDTLVDAAMATQERDG